MNDGSELHRLKVMGDYDEELFNKLFKSIKPLIRKLSREIDARRFNLSPDIIQSYFMDKFLFVFHKYHEDYDHNRLKATLIQSLKMYKNRLLRNAYTELSEYHQSLVKLEDLYDNSKEFVEDLEEEELKNDRIATLYKYMKNNLTSDSYLLFEIEMDPPPFVESRINAAGQVSAMTLIDFFEIPRTKKSEIYISELRQEIKYFIEKAKTELS